MTTRVPRATGNRAVLTAGLVGATLLAAAPTAVNVFIQTRTYGVFARGAARTVALTTALSLLTLALAALLMKASTPLN